MHTDIFTLNRADDICRLLTARLTGHRRPEDRPWQQDVIRHGLPVSALTGQRFTGINALLLWQAACRAQLTSRYWLTGDELRSLGGRIRPGHKPATVVRYRPEMSLFRVINLAQCDNLPPELTGRCPPLPAGNDAEYLTAWLDATEIPVVYREDTLPVWLLASDRFEMSAPPLTPAARSALAAQLVLASLHPQRAGPVPGGHTGPATLVAELGQAFLAARGGFILNSLPQWDGLPDEDPWFLFRAAKTAWRAFSWYEHRLQQRPADDVRQWQQHTTQLLAAHYGQAPEDTTLTLDSVARGHLANGTAPRMAVSALARLYGWPRTDGDEEQAWLFSPDLSPVCDALAAFTLNPARLQCHRVPVEQNVTPCPPALPADSPSLMLPPPADTTRLPAANDNDDPGPDTPPACQAGSSPAPEDAETPPDNLVAMPWVSRTGQPNPHRATFLRQFRETAPHENRWTVFSDLMHLSAAALHNRLAFSQAIEDDYLRRIGRYNRADRFRFQALFQTLVDGMEHSASDFLGSVFMELELGNPDNGQYFTPFSVSHMMARMLLADRQAELDSGEREYISVCDPACGAGGMIVAMACAMLEAGYNPQRQMVAFCTDIDPVAAMMTYIQLSLCGIPAVVTVGNSLTMELSQQWRTPFWVMQGWDVRWSREQARQSGDQNAA